MYRAKLLEVQYLVQRKPAPPLSRLQFMLADFNVRCWAGRTRGGGWGREEGGAGWTTGWSSSSVQHTVSTLLSGHHVFQQHHLPPTFAGCAARGAPRAARGAGAAAPELQGQRVAGAAAHARQGRGTHAAVLHAAPAVALQPGAAAAAVVMVGM